MGKETLVFGANSFIGKHFIEALAEREVIGTARSRTLLGEQKVNIIDVFDYSFESISKLISRYLPERIINFVGARNVERGEQNLYDHLFYVNCQITQRMLEVIRLIGGYQPKIILIGSAAEYGVSDEANQIAFEENSLAKPTSVYGLSKLMQTEIGLYYYRVYDQKINIVRLANVIGLGLPGGFFFSDILRQLKEGKEKIIVGDLSSTRDFITVGDVVTGLKKIFETETRGEVINLSSGKGTRLGEVAEMISQIFKERFNKSIVFEEKVSPQSKPSTSVLDNSKLFRLTGFRPRQISTEVMLDLLEEFSK